MTRRDVLESVHEPFGDAFYYGPEFLGDRFRDEPEARETSGFAETTYKDVLDRFDAAEREVSHYMPKDFGAIHLLSLFLVLLSLAHGSLY